VRHCHDGDISTHKLMSHFFAKFSSMFREPSEEIYDAIQRELDFVQEGKQALLARKNFMHRDDVYIPDVILPLTSTRILTLEYINGFKINNSEAIKAHSFSKKEIASILFDAIAEQTFIHGFLHADPHPGNIFIRPRPSNPKLPQIVLLDHGLYAILPNEFRINYCKFWKAMILGDDKVMKEWSDYYGMPDHTVICTILMMQQFDSIGPGTDNEYELKGKSKFKEIENLMSLSPEEKEKLEKLQAALHKIPEELFLVLRSSFLLRSVNRELGAPLNRFVIMARVAAIGESMTVNFNSLTLSQKVYRYTLGWKFEMRLQWQSFSSWIISLSLNLLTRLGLYDWLIFRNNIFGTLVKKIE